MQVTKEQVDACTVALDIEVDPEAVSRAFDRAYREFSNATRVPGFRPGKAPRAVLERYLDAERVTERATEIVAVRAYSDALAQEQIDAYDEPEVDLPPLVRDAPYRFSTKVPLAPQVTLGDYSDLTVERPVYTVTDQDVENQIQRLREEGARLAVAEGRGVKDGDLVIAEVATTLDGEEPSEPTRTLIRMGDNIPGFDLSITGQRVDEDRTFRLKYPDGFAEAKRAGKNATFNVKVLSINERVLPEVTDDWARQMTQHDSVAALKDTLRAAIGEEMARVAEETVLGRVMEQLIARSTVHFPSSMVAREADREMARLAERLKEQDASYEDFLEHNKLTEEQHRAQVLERAAERARTRLVLRELALREGLEVSDEDVDAEFERAAAQSSVDAKDARRLMKSERHRSQVNAMLAQQKLNDLLRGIATVRDVPVERPTSAAE